jgi:hypothetical protein
MEVEELGGRGSGISDRRREATPKLAANVLFERLAAAAAKVALGAELSRPPLSERYSGTGGDGAAPSSGVRRLNDWTWLSPRALARVSKSVLPLPPTGYFPIRYV